MNQGVAGPTSAGGLELSGFVVADPAGVAQFVFGTTIAEVGDQVAPVRLAGLDEILSGQFQRRFHGLRAA